MLYNTYKKRRASQQRQEQLLFKDVEKRIKKFQDSAPVFKTTFRLEDFRTDTLQKMEIEATRLKGDDVHPQLYSAKWVDCNDRPLLFYLAKRNKDEEHSQVSGLYNLEESSLIFNFRCMISQSSTRWGVQCHMFQQSSHKMVYM